MRSRVTRCSALPDELKRDIDGWRTRVADLEESGALALRVDTERREEAYAARRLRTNSNVSGPNWRKSVVFVRTREITGRVEPTQHAYPVAPIRRVIPSSMAVLRLTFPSRAPRVSVQVTRLQTLWTA
jgi:hypothetical protein